MSVKGEEILVCSIIATFYKSPRLRYLGSTPIISDFSTKMWIEDSGGFKFCSFTRNQIEKCKTSKRSGTPSATDFACKTLYYYVKKLQDENLPELLTHM